MDAGKTVERIVLFIYDIPHQSREKIISGDTGPWYRRGIKIVDDKTNEHARDDAHQQPEVRPVIHYGKIQQNGKYKKEPVDVREHKSLFEGDHVVNDGLEDMHILPVGIQHDMDNGYKRYGNHKTDPVEYLHYFVRHMPSAPWGLYNFYQCIIL